ncbi:beta strand repeat-containing protein, partial [Rhizobiaceae sp. 2RAB30]
ENFNVSANGQRVLFTRNIANIVMDLNDVEDIDLNALGGTDNIVVTDMSGTDVKKIDVSLAGTIGGTAGDGQADMVTVNGTNAGNAIELLGQGTSFTVTGLPALVTVTASEGANDQLRVNGLGGNDSISASTLVAGIVKLTLDGGAGNDTILGSRGADTLIGGDGNDFVDGQQGNDIAFLGAGSDTFRWDPGDGNDTIEGGAGQDRMLFNGANIAESIDISANGGRVDFFRDVAAVTMDLNDVERIDFNALGGADAITVGDMNGTDLTRVNINLASTPGGSAGDGAADKVSVIGTAGNDQMKVASIGAEIVVSGLPAETHIRAAEGALDKLVLIGANGNDTIDAGALAAGKMNLEFQGGLGADVFIGSQGNDLMLGGDGNDVARMGAGDDVFFWNPGDDNDTIEGQTGSDTLFFNGANVGETVDISANGSRAHFFRNIANVTMDMDGVETITFNAQGGSDTVTVNDMSGTAVKTMNVNLAATGGGADGEADTVVINATNGNDTILVTSENGVVTISGLATKVTISNFDANDRIVINGLGGDDVIEASGLGAGMQLTANGGDGDDVLVGGAGNDTYVLENGNDVVSDASGIDTITSTISRNLASYPTIERLTLIGSAAISGLGNALSNVITGSTANNLLYGYGGNDVLNGGTGADRMYGGLGNDRFYVDNAGDRVFEAANQGADAVYASVSYMLAAGQHVEVLATTSSTATTALNLAGNEIAQTIVGNAGKNVISGMGGNDTLTGGAGADYFDFRAPLNPTTNVDRITDFNVAADTIRLENAVMTGLGAVVGALGAEKFWKSATGLAHDANDRIIYETDTGKLFYDSNGNASGGAIHFATLAPNLALTNADFAVI